MERLHFLTGRRKIPHGCADPLRQALGFSYRFCPQDIVNVIFSWEFLRCRNLSQFRPVAGENKARQGGLVQGYLAHKKTPTPLGTPYDPRHSPTVES